MAAPPPRDEAAEPPDRPARAGGSGGRVGDRLAGAVVLVAASWYWWEAGSLEVAFGDPVGPSAFPRLIAVPTVLFALALILRPDPDAGWWHGRQTLLQIAALAVLALFPPLIEPLGFPLASALGAGALAAILGAGPVAAIVTGVLTGPGLFVAFDTALGLPLPLWPAGF